MRSRALHSRFNRLQRPVPRRIGGGDGPGPGLPLWDADTFSRPDSMDLGSTEIGNSPWIKGGWAEALRISGEKLEWIETATNSVAELVLPDGTEACRLLMALDGRNWMGISGYVLRVRREPPSGYVGEVWNGTAWVELVNVSVGARACLVDWTITMDHAEEVGVLEMSLDGSLVGTAQHALLYGLQNITGPKIGLRGVNNDTRIDWAEFYLREGA